MENTKYPYCIHCDAPVDRIDYSAKLKTLVVGVGAMITYVEVSAHCHECGIELYIPEVNDMNKLSRDNAYAAAMKPKGDWVVEETVEIGGIWAKWRCDECGYVRTQGWKFTKDGKKPKAKYCENCGADMRGEKNER